MEKLNIAEKIDNPVKRKYVEAGEIDKDETLGAEEVNSMVNKINEIIDYQDEAFNLKVNTIADLRRIEGKKDGQIVTLLGYYKSGDKGPLNYKWSFKQDEDDGGSVINTGKGSWIAIFGRKTCSVLDFGAKGDGYNDDTNAINMAINKYSLIAIPYGIYRLTDSIILGSSSKQLIGDGKFYRNVASAKVPVLLYDGVKDNTKTVVLIGQNHVGDEPTLPATNIQLSNIHINANSKAGFGIYGTYLTNETIVEKISIENSLEYNFYFAKAWYANFRDLISLKCRNVGLAFGMPLIYSDGVLVNWTSNANLEINACRISNIRSIDSGSMYSNSFYDVTNPLIRPTGYGIGCGIGNSFNLDGYLSEKSGGCGLYIYNGFQPVKILRNGYLEANHKFGTTVNNSAQIIIESTSKEGGSVNVEDVFININSGGIYHTGLRKPIWLKNIHQPTFLQSLDGVREIDLYSFVLKENVYYLAGYVNTAYNLTKNILINQRVNTRYSFNIEVNQLNSGGYNYSLISIFCELNEPQGSFTIIFTDETTVSLDYSNTVIGSISRLYIATKPIKAITRSGTTGNYDSFVVFYIHSLFTTYNN